VTARHALSLRGCAIAALSLLGGCATFGSNVKGSFSCKAPDGICAPSSSIDDRALAMITGEGTVERSSPASSGPARQSAPRSSHIAFLGQAPAPQIDARRTQERVLRIVFQPYIDERGRLHEVTAVHAVVQSGEWQQQFLVNATAIPDRDAIVAAEQPESLAEAVDRAELASRATGGVDPNLPDPAAVAAARARAADPVKAIKDDVATRLAPKAGRTPTPPATNVSSRRAESRSVEGAVPGAPTIEAKVPPLATADKASAGTAPAPEGADSATAIGEAITRVRGSTEYQARSAQAASDAKAAALPGSTPTPEPKTKPTVRAANFPAAAPEEN
jgi:conjugal transfer pilus assembly protein TraV|tara:strand:+ start:12623 stop:13618 length:996 start_codon:yes stop_codon:yes gene_type:complete